MAGIGFELKKILNKQTFLDDITAYVYSAVLSSGPWLMTIISLAVLGIYGGWIIGFREHEIFRSTVIYTYAFSLIFVGIIQLVATRYLADRFYEKKSQITLITFLTCTILLLSFGTLFSSILYFFCKVSLLHKFLGIMLFLVVSMIWLCMIFLSAIKDYNSIINAFAAGALISIIACLKLGNYMGSEGFILGYMLGQALTFFWLLARLLTEFPTGKLWDNDFIPFFKKYWDLMLIGLIYNIAIWADKIVFWFAPDSRLIVPWFRTHDIYEAPVFFSYLTIVPTLAIFLIKLETEFYKHYRQYYGKVLGKKSMTDILQEKELMINSLKRNIRQVFIIQGAVTILCLIFSPELVKMTQLTPIQAPLLRIALIGAFLQALLTINIIIMFYFDLRKSVLAVATLFLSSNAGLSYLSTQLGFQYYGYGYTFSCLLSLIFGFYILNIKLNDLEYITFSGQPVIIKKDQRSGA
ncbi:MAG: exopolysaccharide Pel transporter PelG [Proteobacteria bacterium]|nr:hypothetical protein [Desulfobacteraceae bacterium]MBU3981730.1 exopolysaccharide Pel transporter PelG [Pseudomonadota bacterium]MBU4013411.1 exopolysaccharide Pel transporter PelG [Pseudomonadota bacterium]MBU4067187.1 exopolysaccharide Pel transporter PelG [Pseudomonadota bacterium]MBU4100655.1 exopolysaccharide Pel transporter PelG [Pseudomonadota bacterium]